MKRAIIFACVCISILNNVQAQTIPKSIATDHRIKIVNYDPNNVIFLSQRYGYQTQIAFGANENVQNVSLGDSSAWQIVAINNNLFIKPMASSKTNMTVLTNSNSYNFQLDSTNPNAAPTFKLQFTYPDGGFNQQLESNSVGTFDPAKLNWKYSYSGDRSLAPIEIFDNGQFTYLKFKKDGMNHLPSVFIVDNDRKETLINYHMKGDYMVINCLSKQLVLRDSNSVTSIFNDSTINQ